MSKPIRGRYQDKLPAYDFSDKSPRNLSRGMEMFRWVADRLVVKFFWDSSLVEHKGDIKHASYLGLHTSLKYLKWAPVTWGDLSRACESRVRREVARCVDSCLWVIKPPAGGDQEARDRKNALVYSLRFPVDVTDAAVTGIATPAFELLDEEAPEPLSVDDLRGYIDVTDRNWAIFQRHFRDGASASEISKEFNITERHIVRIYGRVRDDLVKHAAKHPPAQAKLAA